jgi:precorrin-6B methylase 1
VIQIRKRSGEVISTDTSMAVEFVDSLGKLAAVITQSAGGSVSFLTPGDPVFNAYARIQKLQTSKVTIHEPFAANVNF